MAKLLKNGNGSLFFKYFGKKLRIFATGNGNGVQNCLKTMFFEKKHAPFGKKLRNLATGNGNGVQKCLKTMFFEKNTRFLAKSLKFTRLLTPKLKIEGFYCVFK